MASSITVSMLSSGSLDRRGSGGQRGQSARHHPNKHATHSPSRSRADTDTAGGQRGAHRQLDQSWPRGL